MCCCLVRKWRYNLKFCFVCAIEKLKSESTFFKGSLEWNGFSLVITLVEFVNSVRHLMNEWGPWDVVLSGKREIDFTEMQQHCPDFLSHATVNHIINWRIKKSCCRLLKYERCLRALKKFYSHQRDKKNWLQGDATRDSLTGTKQCVTFLTSVLTRSEGLKCPHFIYSWPKWHQHLHVIKESQPS